MSLTSSGSNDSFFKNLWADAAPYLELPLSASIATVPMFFGMVAKSALQKGLPIPSATLIEKTKMGIKAAPTVGAIVGLQMVVQGAVEKRLFGESKSLSSTLASSAIVGAASAPFLAVFNGQTMGWGLLESLRNFSAKQGVAIALQETAFVGGLSVADSLAGPMREKFGDHKAIDYTAAFISGSLGSLAGHPANTALTRWQSGMKIDSVGQLMWGSMRKARAVGLFSIVYKCSKEFLNSTH